MVGVLEMHRHCGPRDFVHRGEIVDEEGHPLAAVGATVDEARLVAELPRAERRTPFGVAGVTDIGVVVKQVIGWVGGRGGGRAAAGADFTRVRVFAFRCIPTE